MTASLASDYGTCAAALAAQLVARGAIRSHHVYEAFRAVPRHVTIPRYYRHAGPAIGVDRAEPGVRAADLIYSDRSVATHRRGADGADSAASRPSHIAHVLEAAALRSAYRVLHVGAGVGYTAALAAHAAEQLTVVAVEYARPVAEDGAASIDRLGLRERVRYYCGDGYGGCAPEAGFDRVIVTTGTTGISTMWLDQLTDGGSIVAPIYVGGLFPLLVIRRGDDGDLIGRPVLANAEFGQATGLLWEDQAIGTRPPTAALPPAEHTGHVPALAGITEDDYLALWLYLAAADQRIAAARTVSLDAEERDRAVLIGEHGVAAIAPDVIAALGPDGPTLARDAERLVERWWAAGRPGCDAWRVRLRPSPGTGAALYTPAHWTLVDEH